MIGYQSVSLKLKLLCLILSFFIFICIVNFMAGTSQSILLFLVLFATLFQLFNIFNIKIYTKIFIGLALGILSGALVGEHIQAFSIVGKAFIQLIKMIVVPLVFASLLVGTASMNNLKKLGQIGIKTLLFYLISTAIAITIGLAIANFIQPGSRVPEEIQSALRQEYSQSAQSKISEAIDRPSTTDLSLDIIPENPARSMADGKMLQIIFFAIISGVAITYLSTAKKDMILLFFEGVTDITIQMVHFIMKLAPYGVFALVAAVIADYGLNIILTLFAYFLTTLLALFIHVFLFNSVVVKFLTGLKVRDFWRGIYPALMVAFSSSSSSATLPVSIECAEDNLSVKPEVASFVIPLGATINMDGTAIFQGVSAVFIASIYGMDLTFADQLTIILTATLASIGTAGAPQVGIIMLTMVLTSIGIPLEGIALILGVERFLDMARTTVNVTSDLSCTTYISHRYEKES